ncbi:MAG: hypothetical protein WCT39_06350, partial [Candidatus Margulisiibacteriota bacterium]
NRDFRSEALNVSAESIEPLKELEKIRSLKLEIVDCHDKQLLAQMKDVLALHNGGDPVIVRMDGRSVELGKGFWVDINPDLVEQLEKLLGDGSVNVEFSVHKRADAAEMNFQGGK